LAQIVEVNVIAKGSLMKTFLLSLAVAALGASSGAALACDYSMKDSEAAAPVDVAKKPIAVAQQSSATPTAKKAVSTAKPSGISKQDKTAWSTHNIAVSGE
jgi:hypothetical protein